MDALACVLHAPVMCDGCACMMADAFAARMHGASACATQFCMCSVRGTCTLRAAQLTPHTSAEIQKSHHFSGRPGRQRGGRHASKPQKRKHNHQPPGQTAGINTRNTKPRHSSRHLCSQRLSCHSFRAACLGCQSEPPPVAAFLSRK